MYIVITWRHWALACLGSIGHERQTQVRTLSKERAALFSIILSRLETLLMPSDST